MEGLLILYVIVRMFANAIEDVSNSVKGRPRRPRLTDHITARRGGKGGAAGGRYGARNYLGDLWADNWQDARARRVDKRQRKAADATSPAQPQTEAPAPVPGRPELRLVTTPPQKPADRADGSRPSPRPAPVVHTAPFIDRSNAGKWSWTCRRPGCIGHDFDLPTEQAAIDAAAAHRCTDGTSPIEGVQLAEERRRIPAGGNGPSTPAARPAASGRRCNRSVCINGQIIGTRPWPSAAGSSPEADQLCDRCGWLSAHITGKTFDQRMGTQHPSTPGPATPPAGGNNNQTPAPPAGKDNPMPTTGEVTNVPAARSFAEAMLAHNKDVLAEIERARASLESRGVSGPVIAELNSLREFYAQAGGRWEGLLTAIGQHERLAEQARATQGAAKDMSFYTNA